ncbi:MAG: DM13 domain-containing protein [Acidimicrobiales bacterium]
MTAVSLLALAASALVGGNLFGARERLVGSEARAPKAPAASREATGPAATTTPASPTLLRSWPWWQDVVTLEGEGRGVTDSFTIADDALQWRVSGTCEAGRLVVSDPSRQQPLIDAACDGARSAYGITSKPGTKALQVSADGPWRLDVDQQVDVPLEEPPLPSMTAPGTEVVATGELYRMDQTGEGTVTVYRLADGTYALRLDDFFVTANVDLEIRLHPMEAPRTTDDYLSAPAALAAPLDITAGSLNFVLPADVDPTKYRSVVIWCPLITSAYAGATLQPAS